MKHILTEILARYQKESLADRKNAVKEVMQKIVFCGLSRSGFFQKAAFYGLNRFSEYLDFSLFSPDPDFSLSVISQRNRRLRHLPPSKMKVTATLSRKGFRILIARRQSVD